MEQRGFFSLSEHLERISEDGDLLEVLADTVDFESFRGWLVEGLGYGDGAKEGRAPMSWTSLEHRCTLYPIAVSVLSTVKLYFASAPEVARASRPFCRFALLTGLRGRRSGPAGRPRDCIKDLTGTGFTAE